MKTPVTELLLAASLASTLLAGAAIAQDSGAVPAATAPAAPGRPADLCQELLAFVKQPEPAKQAAATPPQQATAVSNPSGQSQGTPSAAGGAVQQNSGLSGPTKNEAPAPATTDRKAALAQANAAAKNPPAPGAAAPTPQPQAATVARIEAAAAAGDQPGCRAAAREMRVGGVVLPPPLLALAALDPKFFAR